MSDVFMPAHNDSYQLLGSTLRDDNLNRLGQIVGIDLHQKKPVLDILWQGEKKPVRITITLEQFNQLLQAGCQSQFNFNHSKQNLTDITAKESIPILAVFRRA